VYTVATRSAANASSAHNSAIRETRAMGLNRHRDRAD
jgi:hypothetical protein